MSSKEADSGQLRTATHDKVYRPAIVRLDKAAAFTIDGKLVLRKLEAEVGALEVRMLEVDNES